MSSKFSVVSILIDHTRTLSDVNNPGKLHGWDVAGQFGLPVLAGVIAWLLKWTIGGAGQVVAGVSILTGLLFGLVVWVFQLRITLAQDPREPDGGSASTLVDELFSNVLYAVLSGIVTVLTLIVGTAIGGDAAPLNKWWSAAVIVLAVNLLMTIAMCLKRLRSAYHKLATSPPSPPQMQDPATAPTVPSSASSSS